MDDLARQKDREFYRLEQKRIDESRMFEAEIANYLKTIEARDEQISKLTTTIRKALHLMKYPRIMQLIHRELYFDRYEYSIEEKLAAVKEQIDLTPKEEDEIKEIGIVLCPQTLREFYEHLRCTERDVIKKDEEVTLK